MSDEFPLSGGANWLGFWRCITSASLLMCVTLCQRTRAIIRALGTSKFHDEGREYVEGARLVTSINLDQGLCQSRATRLIEPDVSWRKSRSKSNCRSQTLDVPLSCLLVPLAILSFLVQSLDS